MAKGSNWSNDFSNTGLLGKIIKLFKDAEDEFKKSEHHEKFDALIFDLLQSNKASEETITQITQFLTDPYGSKLFNKYTRILNKVPDYVEYIDLLGDALINISREDYKEKYFDIDFLLTLIKKLSPIALLLLTKLDEWENETYKKTGDYHLVDNLVQGDWYTDFAAQYQNFLLKDGTSERAQIVTMHSRMGIIVRELSNEGIVVYGKGKKRIKNLK